MSRLKYRHEIPFYEEKSKLLKENGWQFWCHYDNWIKTEWYDQGYKVDWMGRSTESAYNLINQNKDD